MPLPFLVAYDQCGLELQTPHMLTTTKRLIPSREVDAALLGRDALRYHGWDPVAVRAQYSNLDPLATYELEMVFACERAVHRVIGIVAGGADLVSPVALEKGGATHVRVAVPPTAIQRGEIELSLECRSGPDAIVSEIRLFSSRPVPPVLTVVGDSRGGLIGTLSDAGYEGIPDVDISVAWPGGERHATSDANGMFRVDLRDAIPHGQHADLRVTATVNGMTALETISTRSIARGLHELPPAESRLDLAGTWQFVPGRHPDPTAPMWADAATANVPGHVAFDGLIPEHGVATLRRTLSLPRDWTGDVVFARFDGVYGRSEVFVNGSLAGVHSAGATSFDIDITSYLVAGENVLTLVITEYTPHAVLDYMAWYAHTSLLGIWREAFLFRVAQLHLGPTDLRADWDVRTGAGVLSLATDVVNRDKGALSYSLELLVLDGSRLVHKTTLAGHVAAESSTRREASLTVPDIEPWSAEIPRRYDLDIVLRVAGNVTTYYRRKVGFRHVEVVGNQLLVNGTPTRLKGVNRHDARMRSGRSMRTEDLRHDVLAFRQANINVIRTAHYPADPRLLEICDELGMYVQDQMPICFAAGFDDHHWTRTNEAAHLVPYVLEVTAETVGRDQVHPSVVIWDLANETKWGWGFDAQLALVRHMDSSRPTLFSFDLNQISDVNPLPRLPAKDRPDIRTYHYPGWDRAWRDDIDWLDTYDQPVVLDECSPPFQDNARAPLHADILAIDPGLRDYWVTGFAPFVARAMRDKGCIGGMIWSAVDDQWTLPIDESVGFGNWSHLTRLDYYRVRDVHPPQGGRVFRGEGEWGLLDGWGRTRPELWHVKKAFSPIEIMAARFSDSGDSLTLAIRNCHAHRRLDTLDLQLAGAKVSEGSLGAGPGETTTLVLSVDAIAETVEVDFRHPEGWMVDRLTWSVPGRAPNLHALVRELAEPPRLTLGASGELELGGTRNWLTAWPRLHVQDANTPANTANLPGLDLAHATAAADGTFRVPLLGGDWTGTIGVKCNRIDVVFDFTCTYNGEAVIDAREIGLAFALPDDFRDLWWQRAADWSAYPPGHIGRPKGYAISAPGAADPLNPAPRWEQDTSPAGSNDYRSTKRSILAGGATDSNASITVISDGSQHIRATLHDGRPILHVLDWYGGVPFRLDTDHIWTANFGTGKRIVRGTTLTGRVTLIFGRLPASARRSASDLGEAEEISR